MKHLLSGVMILVAASLPAFGQTSRDDTRGTGNADEARRSILATDDRRMEAPSGVIRSKDDQINDLVSGRVKYGKIETTTRSVRVYGDVAVVISRDKYDILQDGNQVGGDIFFTRAYKKFGTIWREIAAQGTFVRQ